MLTMPGFKGITLSSYELWDQFLIQYCKSAMFNLCSTAKCHIDRPALSSMISSLA